VKERASGRERGGNSERSMGEGWRAGGQVEVGGGSERESDRNNECESEQERESG